VESARLRGVACIPAELCETATAALLAYRTHCAANSAAGQLILPEALKLLPLYVSCMTRLPAFAQNRPNAAGKGSSVVGLGGLGAAGTAPGAPFAEVAMRCDRRAAELTALNALPVHRVLSAIYSRVYRVDEACMREEEEEGGGEGGGGGGGGATPAGGLVAEEEEEEEEGVVGGGGGGGSGGGATPGGGGALHPAGQPPPHVLRALTRIHLPSHAPSGAHYYPSIELLSEEGAYLVETGSKLYLWVGGGCSEAFCRDVFGAARGGAGALALGTPLPRIQGGRANTLALRRLWGYVRGIGARRALAGTASGELPLQVVVPGDGAGREEVGYALVEDRMPGSGPASASSTTPASPTNARSYVEVLCAIHSAISASISAHA
jgi:hypothetical protein